MAHQLTLNSTSLEELKAKAAALPEFVDTTNATATASDVLSGKTAYVNGQKITGNIATKTSGNLTVSGATVTVPAGYYASQATKSVTTVTRADTTISATPNDTNDTLTYTASNNQGTGYVTGANKTATKTVTLTTSGATATMSDGTNSVSKSVTTASRADTTISTTADDTADTLTITASNNQSTGYVTGANKTASATVTLTTSGATATMSDGSKSVSKSVTTASRAATTMMTTPDDTNDTLTIMASNNQGTGYVTGSNQTASTTITLTASGSSIIASDGTNSISKSVATATQATPTINIDANGKITSSATQTAGYVSEGTKSATPVQLTTQAAKTVTPSSSSQTAVAKNVYTTGIVTVAAIPSEYQNINTLTTQLYNSLRYSGFITSSMTFDQICAKLLETYPELVADFLVLAASTWTKEPSMTQRTAPTVTLTSGSKIIFKTFKMDAELGYVDFRSKTFVPRTTSVLQTTGSFASENQANYKAYIYIVTNGTYTKLATYGVSNTSFNQNYDLSSYAGKNCQIVVRGESGWKKSNSDWTTMTFTNFKVT